MRTTIEIPNALRARVIAEAARLGERGYSGVVVRALRAYLDEDAEAESVRGAARRLRGSERNETTDEAERARITAVREQSRIGKTR